MNLSTVEVQYALSELTTLNPHMCVREHHRRTFETCTDYHESAPSKRSLVMQFWWGNGAAGDDQVNDHPFWREKQRTRGGKLWQLMELMWCRCDVCIWSSWIGFGNFNKSMEKYSRSGRFAVLEKKSCYKAQQAMAMPQQSPIATKPVNPWQRKPLGEIGNLRSNTAFKPLEKPQKAAVVQVNYGSRIQLPSKTYQVLRQYAVEQLDISRRKDVRPRDHGRALK